MSGTKEIIMEAATDVVQAHGYNGLSFRELAKKVGIKPASIHHYFPSKAELGAAIVRRYRENAKDALRALWEQFPDPSSSLRYYAAGFRMALEQDNRMCLCGLLGAEYDELPDIVQAEVLGFIDDNVAWLDEVIASLGDASAESRRNRAMMVYAAISGAQLTARSRSDLKIYDAIIDQYVEAGVIP